MTHAGRGRGKQNTGRSKPKPKPNAPIILGGSGAHGLRSNSDSGLTRLRLEPEHIGTKLIRHGRRPYTTFLLDTVTHTHTRTQNNNKQGNIAAGPAMLAMQQ
jgi:hypothetical protein